jgi:hypothetical protein
LSSSVVVSCRFKGLLLFHQHSKIERNYRRTVHLLREQSSLLWNRLRWLVHWHLWVLLWSVWIMPQQSFLPMPSQRRSSPSGNVHLGKYVHLQGHALLLRFVPVILQQHVWTLWLFDSRRWMLFQPFWRMHRHWKRKHSLHDQVWCHFEGGRLIVSSDYAQRILSLLFAITIHQCILGRVSFVLFSVLCNLSMQPLNGRQETSRQDEGKGHAYTRYYLFLSYLCCSSWVNIDYNRHNSIPFNVIPLQMFIFSSRARF